MKKQFALFYFVLLTLVSFSQVKTYSIRGVVKSNDGYASFAVVSIEDRNIQVLADEKGCFEIKRLPSGTYELLFMRMGLADKIVKVAVVDHDVDINVRMEMSAFNIDEVEVMARRDKADKLVIRETAIEYIQPVSIADLFVLLPGNVHSDNAMTGFNLNSNRQVGTDKNSSLGFAITSDGVPQTSDGVRVQMVGVTENSYSRTGDSQIQERTGINAGSDTRYISTDHIQSVEVTRGISSAKYGNLSAGQILVTSKYGVSPLRVRAKIDLKNKLMYVGKGFSLGKKAGNLHVGADFLRSCDDIREEMEKFSRITGQAYYNNKIQFPQGQSLDVDVKLAQTFSVNKMKKDELTYEYNETYLADYDKTELMLKTKLNVNAKWIEDISFTSSLNRVDDLIDRHYCVITGNPRSMPLSYEEGEHEGYYLPTMYYSDFYIENKPVNLFSQLNMRNRFELAPKIMLNLEYGADFSATKNYGDGAVITNEKYPPFPSDNSYMRPRKNSDIPAIETGGAYMQTTWMVKPTEAQTAKLDLGYRFSQMFNLAEDYALHGKILTEPRLNASYSVGKKVHNTIRFGFGLEKKLPTMDFLYPEKIYKDFWMLNAYTNNPQYRHLITYTKIFDPTNKDILENKNMKFEGGYDFSYKMFEVSITGFYEKSTSGFEYFTCYAPISYQYYGQLREDADIEGRMPEKSDYVEDMFYEFTKYTKVMNSAKVLKRGIEYRIITPKIKSIETSIEINGAYYATDYGSSMPDYYYPNSRVGNSMYPYVGIYDLDAITRVQRINTNFWFNTHIPKFRLIFTNFFQFIWIQTKQKTDNFEGIYKKTPYAYIDFNGDVHEVTPDLLEKINSNEDIEWSQLRRQSTTIAYAREKKPIYMMWNIKVTKEFNDNAKLSFFVNGIFDVHPQYQSSTSARTEREWSNPFFGMEMILNVDGKKKSEK